MAAAHYISKLDNYRLTLTLPVLCGARSVMILAMGAEKAAPLQRVLQGDHDPDAHPVQAVQPANGRLVWIVSADAASQL